MKFLNFLRSFVFKKKEQAPIAPEFIASVVVEESTSEPIVEIPEAVAEQIAGEAVVIKKKKYVKRKK
jgi:hypothetical protein